MTTRVVLADDKAGLRQALRLSLELDGGYEVVGDAANGRDAIDVVVATQPDVLLLDVRMPVMDGIETVPYIRQKAPDTIIVMLSALDEQAIADQAIAAGAFAYLDKERAAADLPGELTSLLATAGRA